MAAKILHIIGEIKIGGVELSVLQFLENALQFSSDIEHYLCAKFSGHNPEWLTKIPTLNLPTDTENPILILWNAFKIARFIKKNRIKIAHSYNRNTTITLLFVQKFLRRKIKTVSSISGIYNLHGFWRTLFNKVFLNTDYTVAPSRCCLEHFVAHYRIPNSPRLHVIYEGIDGSLLPPKNSAGLSETIAIEKDSFKIMMLARFSPIKGQHILVEALKFLPHDFKYQCIFIGPSKPKYEKYIKNLANRLGIKISILYPEFAYLVMHADVIVCPSIRAESFGRVAVEAGFMKKICIASDSGGHLEIIEDGINGFLTKTGNPEDLARKIQYVKNLTNNIKDEIRKSAYETADTHFSIFTHYKQKIKFYKSILNS